MSLRSGLILGIALAFSGLLPTASSSEAEAGRRACRLWNCGVGSYTCFDNMTCDPCQPIQYQEVACQVMVPETHYETRTISVTEYQRQMSERTVTTYRQVPRQVTRKVNYTVCDPVVRERTVPVVTMRPVYEDKKVAYTYYEPVYEPQTGTRTVMEAVWEDVPYNYSVMIPEVKWHTATRMVCRYEPVQTTRTITVDRGRWVNQVVGTVASCIPCGPCGVPQTVCRPIVCPVWQPCIEQQQIPCTTYRTVQVPVEYRYCTTTCRTETHTATRKVCRYVPREETFNYTTCRMVAKTGYNTVRTCRYVQETSSRVEKFTELVPRVVTRDESYTVYDCVPSEQTVPVEICVPVVVQKQIQVPVCRMVAKTITRRVPVPTCTDCTPYSSCPTCIE